MAAKKPEVAPEAVEQPAEGGQNLPEAVVEVVAQATPPANQAATGHQPYDGEPPVAPRTGGTYIVSTD